MRLTAKLTAILVLVITSVVTVQSVRNTERLASLHLAEMRDDLHILASSLGTAAAALWRSGGRERAREYLSREAQHRSWVDVQIAPRLAQQDVVSADRFASLAATARVAYIETRDRALFLCVGIGTDDDPAVLELRYSLASHQRYRDELFEQQIYFGSALVILSGAVLFVVGTVFVGRPLRLLMEQARAVASGDFSVRARIGQKDEVGALAREMNRMSQYLDDARTQVSAERRERTAALGQLRHADRLSTVGKIASSIAHELGTPLNVVAGRATMITEHPDCPQDIRGDAHIIRAQAANMTQLIRQLLDFSRRRSECPETTSLCRPVKRARALLEPVAEEHDIEIVITGDERACARIAEYQALQVLTNLMVNAIQAMPDGGTLELNVDRRHVEAPSDDRAAAGDYVCMSVIDQGVGIADDKLDRVFEPFFTTKENGEGTGLGLSVCHGIVRERGGWLEVESSPGDGSRFSVYIPAVPAITENEQNS